MTTPSPAPHYCSFCGVSSEYAELILKGPAGVGICTACIDQCVGVVARYRREGLRQPLPAPPPPGQRGEGGAAAPGEGHSHA